MKNSLWMLPAIAIGLLLMPGSADGHHGYAAFDSKAAITIKGTVTDFHFTNPHCVVEFEVKDDKGQVRNWRGELTSASHLTPRGWTANSLQPGDELTISGYPAKNGVPSMWITKILLSNGQELKIAGGN